MSLGGIFRGAWRPPSLPVLFPLGVPFSRHWRCHVVTTFQRTRSSPWYITNGHHPKNWKETGIPQRAVQCRKAALLVHSCGVRLRPGSWSSSHDLSLSPYFARLLSRHSGHYQGCVSCFRVFSSWRWALFGLPRMGETHHPVFPRSFSLV